MMIFIASVSTPQQTYNVHLEVGDDDAGRAKVAETLLDIQQRFVPRGEQPKKPVPQRPSGPIARTPQTQGGEANREK